MVCRLIVAALALSSAAVPRSAIATELLVFGGPNHRTFLGCISCSEYDSDSILNEYGPHGSRYSSESIHNHYSEYGSPYSSYSACSRYASDPPVIVDGEGGFYGRLTLNKYHAQATKNRTLLAWLGGVCED